MEWTVALFAPYGLVYFNKSLFVSVYVVTGTGLEKGQTRQQQQQHLFTTPISNWESVPSNGQRPRVSSGQFTQNSLRFRVGVRVRVKLSLELRPAVWPAVSNVQRFRPES